MDKKYLLNHLLRFVSTIVAALLIGFILFHLSGSGESDLSTSVARRISAGQRLTGQAYVFRSETLLSHPGTGVAYSTLAEGERVKKGSTVAGIYNAAQKDLAALEGYDEAIDLLTRSNGKTEGSSLQNDLKTHIAALRTDLTEGDAASTLAAEAKLQIFLNLRKRVNGAKTDYNAEIAALTAEKNALLASFGGASAKISAPISGNFYSQADGYEQIFSSERIDSLTARDLLALSKSLPEEPQGITVGVLQDSAVWYAALVCGDPAAAEMTVGKRYDVDFEGGAVYPMTLHALTPDPDSGSTLIVFRSNLTPPEGRAPRCAEISFYSESHEGLMVPTAAVRYLKAPVPEEGQEPITDDTGVYVREGNKLIFKRVRILCTGEGYYVVAELTSKDKNYKSYLALNDVIVTSGKGLEEGYKN